MDGPGEREQGGDGRARPNELGGAARVAAESVEIVSRPVQGTHTAIADTVFSALRRVGLGPASRPVQRAHDGISAGVYAAVRGVGHLSGRVLGGVAAGYGAATGRGADWRPVTSHPGGAVVTGAVNGLLGDRMAAAGNDLAVTMTLHTASLDGGVAPLPAEAEALRAAVADHPERHLDHVVLFVHGLGETEHAWRIYDEASAGEGYAELLASAVGSVPLLLRYNTGLPLAENGAALSALLDAVAGRWPVPLRRIDLVGHSMGGLVLRHACHHAGRTGAGWVDAVRRMVYLGSPHRGAPLARATGRAATALRRRPGTRAWGELLDRRSAGIDDLVHGVADDEVPLLAGATHHGVAACVTGTADHPLAGVLGDLLVPVDSARGAVTDVEELPSSHHFHLLNDPAVHRHLLRWLADDEPDDGGEPGARPTGGTS